jgi:hypothetical protein
MSLAGSVVVIGTKRYRFIERAAYSGKLLVEADQSAVLELHDYFTAVKSLSLVKEVKRPNAYLLRYF